MTGKERHDPIPHDPTPPPAPESAQPEEAELQSLRRSILAAVSHELKTPLAIIRGYAETLSRPELELDPETLQEGLAIILEETRHMTRLVDDLLDAAQAQEGALTFHLSDVNLPRLAGRLIEGYQATDPGTRWELRFPPEFPSVPADGDRVAQVLRNLLDNARDHAPQGSTVSILGRVEEERIVCCVEDEGPGVSEEDRERIFGRFARGQAPRRLRREGAGLGLFIARALVEGQSGRIWLESPGRGGARFCFSLPRYRSRDQVAL